MSKELKAMQDISDLRNKLNQVLKVSFDFDQTLSEKPMQDLCLKFMKLGAEVYVTTSRALTILDNQKVNHDDLYEVTDRLGIARERIVFTGYEDKYKFLKDMDLHVDDSYDEIFLINQYPSKCTGFLYETKFNNGIKEF